MGDRSQVCIKLGESRVYLYGHWIGADIYQAISEALDKFPGRHNDQEYLARHVFQAMVGDDKRETGFGIGTARHGDIEHAIPVLDVDTRKVSWESSYGSDGKLPETVTFAEFARKAAAGEYDSL